MTVSDQRHQVDNPWLQGWLIILFSCLSVSSSLAQTGTQDEHQHHQAAAAEAQKQAGTATRLNIPDLELLDQNGRKVNFYSDLIKGKTVAINFIFTTCTTVCPPMGATFGKVQGLLGEGYGRDTFLISVSVDPVTDTPERLKAWADQFHAKEGWTLVTGPKQDVDKLLKALGGFTANKEEHSPTVLIGSDVTGAWTRAYGLSSPVKLTQVIEGAARAAAKKAAPAATGHEHHMTPPAAVSEPSPAQKYFTDVELVNQNGETMRFYSDLLKGKVVVINSFFTTCTNVCPPMSRNLEKLQEALGERMGRDVRLISISVDPETDTPPKLKEYASQFHAKDGWYFLTGKKENVERALYKIGQYVEGRDNHLTLMVIGNESTGLWKKAFALAKAEALFALVEGVINNH